jgi:uncharacterized membrane protein YeaQ/YmgE (transglycosylase-associated protein family)
MSVFVWSMIGIAFWHFTILVPDRFAGGIVGAFLAAWAGALVSGMLLEGLEIPNDNPPGLRHVLYAVPGSLIGLGACWALGVRREATADGRPSVGCVESD